jgi:hypothetical protein
MLLSKVWIGIFALNIYVVLLFLMATKTRKKKPKVPVKNDELKAVKLVCPNCGEEETRVIYCESCDTPLEVMDVVSMGKKEAKNNAGVKHDNGNDKDKEESISSSDLLPKDDDPMTEGIAEIFPGDTSVDSISEDTKGFGNIEDMVKALDDD